MDDFDKYLRKQLEDPEFRREWEDHESEYQLMITLMKERSAQNLSQNELAERAGIGYENIVGIENGQSSPTVATLSKLARGLGKHLVIRFV